MFTLSESIRLLLALTSPPAALNTRSDGTDVPWIAKYLRAIRASFGNKWAFAFYQSSGDPCIEHLCSKVYEMISLLIDCSVLIVLGPGSTS